MKKQEVLRQLDRIVTTHKVHLAALQQSEGDLISFCECDYIQTLRGIEYFADAAGAVLSCTDRVSDIYPFEYSFMYKGMKILQLAMRKSPMEVHWDED